MTENKLRHEPFAVFDPHRRKWIAKFQTSKGVKTVPNSRLPGTAMLFDTKEAAELAAGRALGKFFDENPRPRSSKAKTFAVKRNGRNVRTISLPQG